MDYATLTEEQLIGCLEEMRKRGWAVVAYGAAEMGEGPLQDHDGGYDETKCTAFLKENREDIEDAMCSAVWDYCENMDAIAA
jgi:hypothetical protein